jgi:hypothetical protein
MKTAHDIENLVLGSAGNVRRIQCWSPVQYTSNFHFRSCSAGTDIVLKNGS